jgi:hypothetical protein
MLLLWVEKDREGVTLIIMGSAKKIAQNRHYSGIRYSNTAKNIFGSKNSFLFI